jgi:poly-beta-1,6-N-acetyl-D-glucosamine synthase
LGTVQRFEHMIGYRSKKFYTLTNSEFIVGGVASTYRMSALKKVNFYDTDTVTEDIGLSLKLIANEGNRDNRIVYAADVVAHTEAVQTFKQLLRQRYRWKLGCLQNLFKYRALFFNDGDSRYGRMLTLYRLPVALLGECMLILQPMLIAYIVYLSFHLHTLNILIGGYLTITLYTLWTVWPDEHLSLRDKLRITRIVPVMYPLFYIMDIVQLAAIFRCLKDYQKVTKRIGVTSWVSPTRSGQPVHV